MTRVLMKNFYTRSRDIIEQCQLMLTCCQLQIKYSWEK